MNFTQIILRGTIADLPPMLTLVDMMLNRVEFSVSAVKPDRYATGLCKRCKDTFPKDQLTQVRESRQYKLCPSCVSVTAKKRAERKV
jgi:hypothetical protein